MIYLDHNATTPIDERVVEAMQPYLRQLYGNASSLYRIGRISRSAIDSAREHVAALIDASPEQIVFTSGGTEANALAMASARGRRLVISAIEHPSVVENALFNRDVYRRIDTLSVNGLGKASAEDFRRLDLQSGDFVSLMLANNETGVIQDLSGLVREAGVVGAVVHTDAVQALGKMSFSFRALGVQLMSLSSHKIYGPKGCGALVCRSDSDIQPLLRGGDQERGLRAGTENVAAIVGFGKAAELARLELDWRIGHIQKLRRRLEQQLRLLDGVVIFAESERRLVNTVQFGVRGVNGEMLLMQLDRRNIAVSSGSACAAGLDRISPVLEAMGIDALLARSAIRVSLGKDNSENEIDEFIGALRSALAKN